MIGAAPITELVPRCRMTRNGTTLPELVLTCTLVGLLAGMAVVPVRRAADRAALRAARSDLLRGLDAARGAAMRIGDPVWLADHGGRWVVVHSVGTDSAVVWWAPGGDARGVRLTGLATPVVWGAHGMATGLANRTLRLTRGRDTAVVVVSRLGRIR